MVNAAVLYSYRCCNESPRLGGLTGVLFFFLIYSSIGQKPNTGFMGLKSKKSGCIPSWKVVFPCRFQLLENITFPAHGPSPRAHGHSPSPRTQGQQLSLTLVSASCSPLSTETGTASPGLRIHVIRLGAPG